MTSFTYPSHIAAKVGEPLAPRLHGGVTTSSRISPSYMWSHHILVIGMLSRPRNDSKRVVLIGLKTVCR